jgi:hypothetical protein
MEQRVTIINPEMNHSADDEHPFNPKSFSIMRKPLPLPYSSTLNNSAERLLRIKNPPPPAHLCPCPLLCFWISNPTNPQQICNKQAERFTQKKLVSKKNLL